jgi:hypothetical protein
MEQSNNIVDGKDVTTGFDADESHKQLLIRCYMWDLKSVIYDFFTLNILHRLK